MKKLLFLILISFLSLLSLSAEESFYQSIINASYLSSFAYGTFPVSLWADFGVDGIHFADNLSTKIYARVEAGLTERNIQQNPTNGNVLSSTDPTGSYLVAFSDGSAVIEQGVVPDDERDNHDKVTLSLALRMRWEQAFPTFADLRDNSNGIFDSDVLFPVKESVYPGTPELSGDKYFLSNSFTFAAYYDEYYSDYLAPNGYKTEISMVFAPFWLANDLDYLFKGARTDAYKIRLSGNYDYTILDKKSKAGKNLYSMYVSASASTTFLFGSSIPRYMQDKSFMGISIVPRLFYADISGRFQINGPEFLTLGTYPSVYVTVQNGLNAGPIINNKESALNTDLYGGFSIGTQMTLIGYLKAFMEYSYIYAPSANRGHVFNAGCYLSVLF